MGISDVRGWLTRSALLAGFVPLPLRAAESPDAPVLFDMDAVRHKVGQFTDKEKKKVPAGTAELVEGKFGKAVRFSFAEGSRGGFMMAGTKGSPAWDAADGFSFWVKGDGSQSFGGIELIDGSDFGIRFGYCFPIDSTEWRRVVVRWTDLTPEIAGPVIDPKGEGGYRPSKLGNLWFGKFHFWKDYPAHSYTIDQVAIEPVMPSVDAAVLTAKQQGLSRVRGKLERKEPVTIVTMGDSLSDERHWANRETLWSKLLVASLKQKYGSDVTLINPAVGGSTLSQNVVLIPRWAAEAPSPDLVTIWFGGNDWESRIRGPRFTEYLKLAIDRVRATTGGKADIAIMTTNPSHARWEEYKELEEAAKTVASEKGVAVIDVASAFRAGGTSPDAALKDGFWVWDKVHLGPKGHEVARDAVMKGIEELK